jgi:hypothetical protein
VGRPFFPEESPKKAVFMGFYLTFTKNYVTFQAVSRLYIVGRVYRLYQKGTAASLQQCRMAA